jgi:hypothetical protein
MTLASFIAAGDGNWIGLVLLLIFAVVSAVSKAMEKRRESQLPDEPVLPQAPRPRPPPVQTQRRAPMPMPPVFGEGVPPPMRAPAPPVARLPERSVLEERMRQILEQAERRVQRQPRPAQLPPVIVEPEEKPRRLVDRMADIERQKAELPSGRPGEVQHAVVLPSVHPEEVPHETILPSALKQSLARQMTPTVAVSMRAARFQKQLQSRGSIRQAIVLREVLGPPLALREDW